MLNVQCSYGFGGGPGSSLHLVESRQPFREFCNPSGRRPCCTSDGRTARRRSFRRLRPSVAFPPSSLAQDSSAGTAGEGERERAMPSAGPSLCAGTTTQRHSEIISGHISTSKGIATLRLRNPLGPRPPPTMWVCWFWEVQYLYMCHPFFLKRPWSSPM